MVYEPFTLPEVFRFDGGETLLERRDSVARQITADVPSDVPAEWAEGFARLHVNARPVGFTAADWRQALDDGDRFLAGSAAGTARALGWTALDVFGLFPAAPASRFEFMGLLWFLDGGEVETITATDAVILRRSGSRLTYRRQPLEGVAVPAWNLVKWWEQ